MQFLWPLIKKLWNITKAKQVAKAIKKKVKMGTPFKLRRNSSWIGVIHDMDDISSLIIKNNMTSVKRRSKSTNCISRLSKSDSSNKNDADHIGCIMSARGKGYGQVTEALHMIKKAVLLKKSLKFHLKVEHIESPWPADSSNSLFKTPNYNRLEFQKRLPKHLIDTVIEKMSVGDCNEILVSKFGLDISRQNIECLHEGNWLNDEVINFYMSMLQIENDKYYAAGKAPKCYIFNTFFFPSLTGSGRGYNYSAVQRWTKRKKIDIFTVDILLVPVHVSEVHWALGVIDMRASGKQILMLDSLGGSGNELWFQVAKRYIKDEYKDKKNKNLLLDDWNFDHSRLPSELPLQENGYDCGVFMCQYAHCVVHQRRFDFTQQDIPSIRLLMAHEIMQGYIIP
ncbi:sentrin-specific protease 1 [Babesia microti strain RI]|uniref:Sentrin-specific protease 1 n=1 Tax=Babesia microti (strain RI) TaxID=1133968 RepID=I7IQ89_BABMR|nr:sentrin-specific protease 1 [Babesia microti strain RI]CCF73590.1 sentrin-specific protease 1 [Babesia microti strain RI]|eukprot:XP_012648199.1 sentrin-specific protease 1 [Babesia microti strain RI]